MCCNIAVWIFFGNAVFAPGTKHYVREFMFVFICSGSRWRFVLLQLGCLRCLAQQDLQMPPFLVFVQLVQLVVHVSAPSFFALVPSQLSEDPSRTFDSHVSVRYSQLVLLVSHRKPKHLWREYHSHSSAATGHCLGPCTERVSHHDAHGVHHWLSGIGSCAELHELHVHSCCLTDKHCGLHQNQP